MKKNQQILIALSCMAMLIGAVVAIETEVIPKESIKVVAILWMVAMVVIPLLLASRSKNRAPDNAHPPTSENKESSPFKTRAGDEQNPLTPSEATLPDGAPHDDARATETEFPKKLIE